MSESESFSNSIYQPPSNNANCDESIPSESEQIEPEFETSNSESGDISVPTSPVLLEEIQRTHLKTNAKTHVKISHNLSISRRPKCDNYTVSNQLNQTIFHSVEKTFDYFV